MLLLIILVLGFIKVVVLYRGYHVLPIAELKRKSRGRDPEITKLFKVAAFGQALDLFLWLCGVALASAVFILAARSSWWLACLFIALFSWLLFWAPRPKPHGFIYKFTVLSAPYMYKLMLKIRPVLDTMFRFFPGTRRVHFHTGVYEKADLLEIIARQKAQADNRVPKEDLEIAENALTFGDKKVMEVMTPRSGTRFVKEDESIGPMLMDELHATSHTTFAVIRTGSKPSNPEVIGLLYLDDLVANPDKSKIKDLMHRGKTYINEDTNLRDALDEFIKNKTHLMVVVNNFEEVVGTLAFDKIMEQILGQKLPEEIVQE